jgi:hypothetical protein
MRPGYIAILLNSAVFLWLFSDSVATYVHYYTDPEWLAYGVAVGFQYLFAIRWSALALGLVSLFIRRVWAILLLVASHVILLSGPIGAAIGMSRVVGWSEIPASFVIGWAVTATLSLVALSPLLFARVRHDLARARVAA